MDKATPSMQKLSLNDREDEDVEDLFASPESGATTQKHTPNSQPSTSAHKQAQHTRSDSRSQQNTAEAREAQLRAELERVREVNKVIESVTASLTKAKDNMSTVNQTVHNASTLLATWTRILSQTEHNQRLILNPSWQGATKDLEDMENEDLRRQQEAERRAEEDRRRREELGRKREEEEERRKAMQAAAAPERKGSTRGRGVGARGGRVASSGYGRVTPGTSSSSTAGTKGRGSSSGVSGVRGTRASARAASGRGRGVG